MTNLKLFKWISLVLVVATAAGLFGVASTSKADGLPLVNAASVLADGDDSGELPIYIDISGPIQAMTSNSITLEGVTVQVPDPSIIPFGIGVGTVVTIRVNLKDDDSLIAIIIIIGAPPSPTPIVVTVPPDLTLTPVGTLTPTPIWTPTATGTPATVIPTIQGCGLPKAILALYIAKAYGIPLDQLDYWHCQGHAYGVIARAYIIVFAASLQNGNTTIEIILDRHAKGKHWNVIIVELGITIDPNDTAIIVSQGNAQSKGCPPGLAKKGKDCQPPGKKKK